MLSFIISLLFHFGIAFLLMFVYEDWSAKCPVELRMPTVDDLNNFNEISVSKYINNHINPAYHYFILKHDLSYAENETSGCFTPIAIQIATFLFTYKSMLALSFSIDKTLQLVLLLAFCCAICFLMNLIYKKTLVVGKFSYTAEELQKNFIYTDEEVTEETAYNNYVISIHYNYLLSVKERTLTKKYISKVLSVITVILYILFVPHEE